MKNGLTKEDFAQLLDRHVSLIEDTLNDLINKGLLKQEGDKYFFTKKGQLISDAMTQSSK